MVSIIIPVFNRKKYTEAMISSIVVQTNPDWELLLVDDGSTDGTLDLLKSFVSKDNRIKLFQRDRLPKGGQTCRNIGFENSQGEYVIFFDSDDLIAPYCIEQRIRFMNEHKNVDFGIFPAHTFFDERNHSTCKKSDQIYGVKHKTDALSSFLRLEYQFTIWTNIYRKSSIVDLSWDENVLILQDLDFNISALIAGKSFAFAEDCKFDYYYRILYSSDTVCANFVSKEKCESTIYLFSKTLDKLSFMSDFKKYKRDLAFYIALYFERILIDADIDNIEKYLKFCHHKYSKSLTFRLSIVAKATMLFKSPNARMNIPHVFNMILIPRMGLSSLINKIKSK
ncbi:glycosyl transferase family 2 [Paludibacter propionicigenes WB4]|uniref:Glycosyl transferase family 2 n=1 Tax=Paludibacter propionicigenes (strain DSM 17365 / JCM 13257 / WB4) TaxID=694427 RepID=E4T320_PALPW|nr:glycosyltransferase family 2 protein [Paludibacter propionicigenes]ADQ79114.1 glycosyl transferase family 2 [Paludibacter propionicigenes WB4]